MHAHPKPKNVFFLLCFILLIPWDYANAGYANAEQAGPFVEIKTKRFELLGAPLAEALLKFAIQSETSVLVEADQVAGYRSSAIVGQFPIERALKMLLSELPFTYRYDQAKRAFLIVEKNVDSNPPLQVNNESLPEPLPAYIEEIIVTGVRASLVDAMNRKRFAADVLEAVTAEDIGKFPDSNLSESLQRVSGVTINYANNEGDKVSVRGLHPGFNLVTLNGRQMPIADLKNAVTAGTRSFSFADIASENIAAVEIYKTSAAHRPSGGIGSLIDIQTTRPFDLTGVTGSIGVKAVSDTSNENGQNITPEISGLYSQTFGDKHFGILLSGTYQERDSREERADMNWGQRLSYQFSGTDWSQRFPLQFANIAPAGPAPELPSNNWFPKQLNITLTDYQAKRSNANAVLQFSPNTNITTTIDYTYSKMDVQSNSTKIVNQFRGILLENYPVFDSNGTVIATTETWDANVGGRGLYSFERSVENVVNENNSYGVNIELNLGESFSFALDAHESKAELQPQGDGSRLAVSYEVRNVHAQSFDVRGDIPSVNYIFEDLETGDLRKDFEIRDFIDLVEGVATWNTMNANVSQIQFHGNWHSSSDTWLRKVNFGLANTVQENRATRAARTYYNPYRGIKEDSYYDPSIFSRASAGEILQQFSHGLGNNGFYYDFDINAAITANTELFPEFSPEFQPGPRIPESFWLDKDPDRTPFWDDFQAPKTNPDDDNSLKEDIVSAYLQVDLAGDLFGMPFELLAGLRYEDTKITSRSAYFPPSGVGWRWGAVFFTEFTEEKVQFIETASYGNLLPSISARIELTDTLVTRFATSESISRSEMDFMRAETLITRPPEPGTKTAFEGAVGLLPYTAKNYDASIEWYYSDASYLALTYFKKNIDNFPINVRENKSLFGLTDPYLGPRADAARQALAEQDIEATTDNIYGYLGTGWAEGIVSNEEDPLIEWSVTRAVNAKRVSIDGVELTLQQVFGRSGFGFMVNYTQVNSDIENGDSDSLSSFSSSLPTGGGFMNWVGFYDKNSLEVRLAYHWNEAHRSLEETSSFDHWNGVHAPVEVTSTLKGLDSETPVFINTEAYGQWDAQISYALSDNLTGFFEATNITNKTQRSYIGQLNRLFAASQSGPRYKVGFRYVF